MNFASIATIVSTALKPLSKLIDNVHTSDEERLMLRNEYHRVSAELTGSFVAFAVTWLETEAKSESWLPRNWRAITMTLVISMLVYNVMIFPFLNRYLGIDVKVEVPDVLIMAFAGAFGVGTFVKNKSEKRKLREIKRNMELCEKHYVSE